MKTMGKEGKNKPRYVAKTGYLSTLDLVKISEAIQRQVDQELELIRKSRHPFKE